MKLLVDNGDCMIGQDDVLSDTQYIFKSWL